MPRKKSFHVSLLKFGKFYSKEKCEIHETLGAASYKIHGWVISEYSSLSTDSFPLATFFILVWRLCLVRISFLSTQGLYPTRLPG
jgi:hypothetical protein